MSKALSEAYLSRMYDKDLPHVYTNRKGKARPRERRQKPQIEGQLSFVSDENGGFYVDDCGAEARKQQFKQDSLAYYHAFRKMLKSYGSFNMYSRLWEELQKEHPSRQAINALNYEYGGDPENVELSLNRSLHWVRESRRRFSKAAERVHIFDVDKGFDSAYCDPERRNKFYAFIRREIKKVENDKAPSLYRPRDFEDNYQQNRAKLAAKRAAKGDA